MAVGALVHGDGVPGPGQLLGGGQPGRTGADHRDRAAGGQLAAAAGGPSPRPRPGR